MLMKLILFIESYNLIWDQNTLKALMKEAEMESYVGWIVFLKDYFLLTSQNFSETLQLFYFNFIFTIILFDIDNLILNDLTGEYL